jgi:hypothetical protein
MQAATMAVEQDKVIEKSFPINADGTLDITNKYGSVDITAWDKNEVSIKVTITVKTSSQKKAEEVFDRIDIEFENSKSYVSAVTEIESNDSWFGWSSWGNAEYQIDYDVKMPRSVHLKCANKYGNTFVTDLNNGAELVIGYGNIRMGSVEGPSNIDLAYSNLDFGDLGDLTLIAKYSKIKGSSTQAATIDSKYSNTNIGEVSTLKSESKYDSYIIDVAGKITNNGKYDNWEVNEVTSISSDTKYTTFDIGSLRGDMDIDQKYGSIRVAELACTNAEIDIDVEYTGVFLDTRGCENLEIEYNGEYTDTNFSGDLDDQLNRDGKSTWLKAKYGSGGLDIKLNMKYGDIKMRQGEIKTR